MGAYAEPEPYYGYGYRGYYGYPGYGYYGHHYGKRSAEPEAYYGYRGYYGWILRWIPWIRIWPLWLLWLILLKIKSLEFQTLPENQARRKKKIFFNLQPPQNSLLFPFL